MSGALVWIEALGLFGRALANAATRRFRWREFLVAVDEIGAKSVPLIVVATSAAGVVLCDEIAWHLDRSLHTVQMIPGFTGQMLLNEIGVVVPAFLLLSRAGAAMTAEIGSMKVTEQLDALALLRIDRVALLVVPRLFAFIVSSVMLTLLACAASLIAAIGLAIFKFHFNPLEYLNGLRSLVGPRELGVLVLKSVAFGAAVPVICCTHGFRCRPGAQGVGEATTQAVIHSTLAVILLDFVITFFFSKG